MRHEWDPFLDDLEHQFAAQAHAEHRELDVERERARVAALAVVDRLRAIAPGDARIAVTGATVRGAVRTVGTDWCALVDETERLVLIPVRSIRSIGMDPAGAARASRATGSDPLAGRMSFGFALRALGRRRAPVDLLLADGGRTHGTIVRAGADHLDLAMHERDVAPRADDVREVAIIPFARVSHVRVERRGDRGAV